MLAVLVQHVSAANEHPGQTHGHVSDLQDDTAPATHSW